ncbi:MAG TPA: DUF4157 domain-containing protein, partial [Longimicrobiales bacterium]
MPVRRRSRSSPRVAAAPPPGHAPPRPRDSRSTPRWLAGRSADVVVQREPETPSAVPRYQLTPPSLLQPPDPYARFRPNLGLNLHLDPDLEARILAQGRALLSPANVLASVAPVAPSLGMPGAAATPGTQPVPPAAVPGPVASPPAVTPQATPSPATAGTNPTTPAPAGSGNAGAQPEPPHPGGAGDVMSAVLALPQVHLLLEDVQSQFTTDFSRYWQGASTGEQIGFVTSSVVVGAGILGPALGFKEPRNFFLPLLNDVVLPVPGLSGYGLEFHFGEHDVMIGAHLDVGVLLPSILNFGPASFSPIGGPPGSVPVEPPISRKAAGDVSPDAAGVAEGIRAQAGGGSALDDGLRAEIEPVVGEDLRGVRLHTDAHADDLARAVHAQAFTSGRDLFFRAGRYAPRSAAGRELLAHELVHVGQQARAGVSAGGGGLRISEP